MQVHLLVFQQEVLIQSDNLGLQQGYIDLTKICSKPELSPLSKIMLFKLNEYPDETTATVCARVQSTMQGGQPVEPTCTYYIA